MPKLYGFDEYKKIIVEVESTSEDDHYYHLPPVVRGRTSMPHMEWGFGHTENRVRKSQAFLSPEELVKAWFKIQERKLRYATKDYAHAYHLMKTYDLKP